MTQQPHEVIWTLTNAVVLSSSVHAVAELGVADHVGDGPVNVRELASRCGADPDALHRVLRLLATHGVFSDVGGAYEHTEPSRLLCSDHPRSLRAFSRMIGLPIFSASFGQLQHSICTGSPALDQAGGWQPVRVGRLRGPCWCGFDLGITSHEVVQTDDGCDGGGEPAVGQAGLRMGLF